MIYRDIDLRGMGYDPVPSPYMFQCPMRAFAHSEVGKGDAVVFQIGRDIWAVYHRPELSQ